jgi:hypothetical protein
MAATVSSAVMVLLNILVVVVLVRHLVTLRLAQQHHALGVAHAPAAQLTLTDVLAQEAKSIASDEKAALKSVSFSGRPQVLYLQEYYE